MGCVISAFIFLSLAPVHAAETFCEIIKIEGQATLLAKGATTMEISEALRLSNKTVRTYISGIIKILKVRNRTQAALIASRAMLHPSPSPARVSD